MRAARATLSANSRRVVLESIRAVCEQQSWTLHAAHVRSTHVHVVLSSSAKPEAVMTKLKGYASRALGQTKCWSRHGSTEYIWSPHQLQSAIEKETSHLGPQVTQVNAGLAQIAGGLTSVDKHLVATIDAVTAQGS
jgi:REP element-mobilizing transposase RayT